MKWGNARQWRSVENGRAKNAQFEGKRDGAGVRKSGYGKVVGPTTAAKAATAATL